MKKLLLGFHAMVLVSAASVVAAQSAKDQTEAQTTTSTTTTTTTDRVTNTRLAAIDTSDAAFRKLDTDNDGRISALEAANDPKLATAFTMADRDKDGYLSKEEFKSIKSAGTRSSDADASTPSGDHVSYPGGDETATVPSDPGITPATTPAAPRN